MKRILYYIIVISSFSCVLHSFIYEIKILRRWNPECQRYHYFIGLSDFHDKSHEKTDDQMAEIMNFLVQCNKDTTKIILEDLSSQGKYAFNGRFKVNSRGGILGGLATTCCDKGFEVENVEYRYCRVSALGPVLNHLNKKPHLFPSVKSTKVASIAQEIDVIVDEIADYKDGNKLDSCYKHCLKQVMQHLAALNLKKHGHLTVADYLVKHTTKKDRLEFLKHLLTFDSSLLDVKMVHAVINAPGKNLIIAISGGAHIGRVSELLEKIGYESVYATTIRLRNEYDLKKCLGSTIIDGCYCVHPEPISLGVIKQYL